MVPLFLTTFMIASLINHLNAEQDEYDVIIMGAGMAGITAAKNLYDAGIDNILIIEAQDYIGGRMKTIEFANYSLNGGASWIHGACLNDTNLEPQNFSLCTYHGVTANVTNPMLELAYRYNISFAFSDYVKNGVVIDFGGTEHDMKETNDTREEYEKVTDCIDVLITNISRGTIDDMSFFAAAYVCGWRQPFSSIEKTTEWGSFAFEFAQQTRFTSTYGSYLDTYATMGEQDLFITDPRGYQGIILLMAEEFLDIHDLENEPKIRLNAPIANIKYDQNGVTVTLDEANNGDVYYANYGIVTFSVGVMQSDIVTFDPVLPDWKRDAFLTADFAHYVPIYVKWPYNFWDDQVVDDSEFIYLNDDRFGFFTWIMNLDAPGLFNGSLLWRFDIALDIAKIVEDQSINDTVKMIIDLKLKHYFDLIPDPEDIYVSDWSSNRYIQGAYSNWALGMNDATVEAMAWHLHKRLFFAGEATDYNSGYVHSAFFSGNDTANELLACMGYDEEETDGFVCPDEWDDDTLNVNLVDVESDESDESHGSDESKRNKKDDSDDSDDSDESEEDAFSVNLCDCEKEDNSSVGTVNSLGLWVCLGIIFILGAVIGCIFGRRCDICTSDKKSGGSDIQMV